MDCFKTVMGNPTYFNKPDDVSEDLKKCIESGGCRLLPCCNASITTQFTWSDKYDEPIWWFKICMETKVCIITLLHQLEVVELDKRYAVSVRAWLFNFETTGDPERRPRV